jgi:hypothetical protein
MSPPRLSWFLLLPLLVFATSAPARDDSGTRAVAGDLPRGFDQVVYKGVVGNVLDTIPMDASDRLDLQRTNAVVSNTLFGRSLTVLAGLSNPVLLVGGLAWGIWAASNIKPAAAGMRISVDTGQSGGTAAAHEGNVAMMDRSSAADNAPANRVVEPVLVSAISSGDSDAAAVAPSHVVRIWLPQRSPVLSR